jgi:anti-sigma B factor antagonist
VIRTHTVTGNAGTANAVTTNAGTATTVGSGGAAPPGVAPGTSAPHAAVASQPVAAQSLAPASVPSQSLARSAALRSSGGRRARQPAVSGDPVLGIVVQVEGDCCRVVVSGELDGQTAPQLSAVLDGQVQREHVELQVDVAGMTFVDLRGVYVLMAAAGRARAGGGRLRVRHPSPLLARMAQLCGVEDMLERPSPGT